MTADAFPRARRARWAAVDQERAERFAGCSATAWDTYLRVRKGIYSLLGDGADGVARLTAETALELVDRIRSEPDADVRLGLLRELGAIEERAARGYQASTHPRKERAALKAFRACPRCSACGKSGHVEDATPPA